MSINVFSLKDYSAKRAMELAGGTGKGVYVLVQITSFGHKIYAGWSDKNVFSRVKSSSATLFKKKQFVPDFAISYNMGRTFGNNVVDNTALVEKQLIDMLFTSESNHLHVLNINRRISCNVGHLDDSTVFVETVRAKDLAKKMLNLVKNHSDEILSAAKPVKTPKSATKTVKPLQAPKVVKPRAGHISKHQKVMDAIECLIINTQHSSTPYTREDIFNLLKKQGLGLDLTIHNFHNIFYKVKANIQAKYPTITVNLMKPGQYSKMHSKNATLTKLAKSETPAQSAREPVVSKPTASPNYRPRFNFDYNIAPIGNEYFVTFMPVIEKQKI